MDPYTPSQCPLCRAEYAHFPQVLPSGRLSVRSTMASHVQIPVATHCTALVCHRCASSFTSSFRKPFLLSTKSVRKTYKVMLHVLALLCLITSMRSWSALCACRGGSYRRYIFIGAAPPTLWRQTGTALSHAAVSVVSLSHMVITQLVLMYCMCCYIVCLLLYQLLQYYNVISATFGYTLQASSLQPSATGHWSKSHFPCIACHKLLYNPVVLNCGHAVCNATCRPVAAPSEDPVCPCCDAPSVKTPAVCTQVRCLPCIGVKYAWNATLLHSSLVMILRNCKRQT